MSKNDQCDGRKPRTGVEPELDGKQDDINLVNRIRQIFSSKQWPLSEEDMPDGGGPFERTVSMLTHLNKEESKLILELLEKFSRFELAQYTSEMRKLIVHLVNEVGPKKIAIVPIKSFKDSKNGASKSGDMMGVIARTAFQGLPVRVEYYNDLTATGVKPFAEQIGAFIVGVDDFVGTGDTAVSFVDNYLSIFPGKLAHLKMATLVSLEMGTKMIQNTGCDLYCLNRFGRGISDCIEWSLEDRNKRVETMRSIESRIGIREEFSMGYGKSEGLVKMMRTPNNTFPIFWATKSLNGAKWPAIFPR